MSYKDSNYSNNYPAGYYVYQESVARYPDRMYQFVAHGHDRLHWADDPFQQQAFVKDDLFHRFNGVNRTIEVTSLRNQQRLPGRMEESFFYYATGIWPIKRWTSFRPEGTFPFTLREVAMSDKYTLRVEDFEGMECHVLELPQRDQLWFDVLHDCRLIRRKFISPDTGQVMQEIRLRNQVEVIPRVWIPKSIEEIHFDITASTTEGRNRIVRQSNVDILKVEVNKSFDDQLELSLPPGTLYLPQKEEPIQIKNGGVEHLDSMVEMLTRFESHSNRNETTGDFRSSLIRISLIGLAFTCILCGIMALIHRRRLKA
ncbi:hypothetical protein [Gimesia aquarii]|uniref:hypothetical protein n=1 Tax=Gimesia aquarii TaxID=2527964 RepID=UPI00119D94BE|nr:hypothetical protein [Gimesia aquarii]